MCKCLNTCTGAFPGSFLEVKFQGHKGKFHDILGLLQTFKLLFLVVVYLYMSMHWFVLLFFFLFF